jgi:hypothetical protein
MKKAITQLVETPLYKEYDITVNNDWEMNLSNGENEEDFEANTISKETSTTKHLQTNSLSDDDDDDAWSEFDDAEIMSGATDTLLTAPDFVEPHEKN